jgi:hypothetical protein
MSTAGVDPELFRALGALCEAPDPAHRAVAGSLDLTGWPGPQGESDLFTVQLLPYASIYLGHEGMLGGEAAGRIAGFWHAVGYDVPAEPDHLAALLGLYAALMEAEAAPSDPARRLLRRQARAALLWEHLLTWVPAYAAAVAGAGADHHADWAALLTEALLAEGAALDPPAAAPAHLADVPALPEPDDGVDALVRALLTPIRSGIVLTRSDLIRFARGLGLGVRIGERAFVLHRLLEADAVGMFDALEDHALVWAARHDQLGSTVGTAAEHWKDRAEATAEAVRHRGSLLQEVLADVR